MVLHNCNKTMDTLIIKIVKKKKNTYERISRGKKHNTTKTYPDNLHLHSLNVIQF